MYFSTKKCCAYSKEPSYGSFVYTKHMLILIDKEKNHNLQSIGLDKTNFFSVKILNIFLLSHFSYFLIFSVLTCFGCSKEQSHRDNQENLSAQS